MKAESINEIQALAVAFRAIMGQNRSGQRCAGNASPALEHSQPDKEVGAMPHQGYYVTFAVILNTEHCGNVRGVRA